MKKPYAIAIVGNSGAGKTTLLERLIPALKGKGLRVGVVKHDAHRFDIDHPGKDSHRLTAAGADTMMITSAEKLAMVKRHAASPPIEELLERYFSDMDLVLVEGFRGSSLPKIEVHRKDFARAHLPRRAERSRPGGGGQRRTARRGRPRPAPERCRSDRGIHRVAPARDRQESLGEGTGFPWNPLILRE
jgi:molybdopterin-guanine dinucleotide biosynthesis protein MobB